MYTIRYSGHIFNELEFSQQIFDNPQNINYHVSPSSGSRVVPCEQTDRHNEANSRSAQHCERVWKRQNEGEILTALLELRYFWRSESYRLRLLELRRLRLKRDGTRAETRFRLLAKWTSLFKLARASVQSTTGSRGVRISGSNVGYTIFRDSVKGTGYPLHSPVSPLLPLPCVTVCHHVSTRLYY
jgi:hypothetical protein